MSLTFADTKKKKGKPRIIDEVECALSYFPGCCRLDILHDFESSKVPIYPGEPYSTLDNGSSIESQIDYYKAHLAVTVPSQKAAIKELRRLGFKAIAKFSRSAVKGFCTLWLRNKKG